MCGSLPSRVFREPLRFHGQAALRPAPGLANIRRFLGLVPANRVGSHRPSLAELRDPQDGELDALSNRRLPVWSSGQRIPPVATRLAPLLLDGCKCLIDEAGDVLIPVRKQPLPASHYSS